MAVHIVLLGANVNHIFISGLDLDSIATQAEDVFGGRSVLCVWWQLVSGKLVLYFWHLVVRRILKLEITEIFNNWIVYTFLVNIFI